MLNRVSGVVAHFTDLLLVALGLLALSGHRVDLCPGLTWCLETSEGKTTKFSEF